MEHTGPLYFLPMAKGDAGYTRPAHGWATAVGVLQDNGSISLTKDREGEFMLAAGRPETLDASEFIPRGWMNYAHRAVPAEGASCPGRCHPVPSPACAVHGGKRVTVAIGVPERIEFVSPDHELAHRDGKVGVYDWFHIIDSSDPASWKNPDGTPRMRMLRDGTVTDEPFEPTPEERDRADDIWQRGLRYQREGRTLGQSIQGRETVRQLSNGAKGIVRAVMHQVAVLEYPHHPDATVESFGHEMAKGEAPIVTALAERLVVSSRFRKKYGRVSAEYACDVARNLLKMRGIYYG